MIEHTLPQKFRYTAVKGPFFTIVGVFGGLLLIESSVFVLLALLLVPHPLKWPLAIIIFLLILFMLFGVLLSALRTGHTLTSTELRLHYGHLLHIIIPRTEILMAQPVHEHLSLIDPISARYDEKRQRITASFSEQGQILLTLKEALSLKLGRKAKMVQSLLINVDRRERLLDQLYATKQAKAKTETLAEDAITLLAQQLTASQLNREKAEASVALHVEGLTRRFKQFVAVDQLDMQIYSGEIYGLLGSNGAGKTTTMKMLAGLLVPDAGQIELLGIDLLQQPEEVKRILGYVPDRSLLYERLTGREFLEFLAQVRGLDRHESKARIEQLLELLELKEQAGRLCGSYSFGMKRKLSLAGALLHQPGILILDEPLNGLDPRSARHLKDLFLALSSAGTTILLSTHDLATAEEICHRVGIFHRGRLLAEGSPSALRQTVKSAEGSHESTPLEAIFLDLTHGASEEVPA